MRLISSRCILLISHANSYRIAPYLNAARHLGLDVLIASRGEYSLVSEVHDGLHVDLDNHDTSLAAILERARETPFAGILGSDDSTVELAAKAAEKLGLPHNPPDAAQRSRRKDLARAHLAAAGCPVPHHCLINLSQPVAPQMPRVSWPCVIKPVNLSASRGVIRANNPDEFIAACARIQHIISESVDPFEKTHVLVEDYIEGVEVAYEGFLQNGELSTLALFDKPDPLQGPCFAETIYVTPSQLDAATQHRIKQRVEQACTAYGLTTGPVHAELRINEQDAWILEVASRTIGGECARMLDSGSGLTLEELSIALAIGAPIENKPRDEARGVMMLPVQQGGILRRVEGQLSARNVPLIDKVDIIIREGNELIPLPEGNQYPGYIFARGKTPDMVVQALRESCSKLTFVVAPVLRLTPLQ